ncbi:MULTISPECIES: universal stress protein [Haloarcula]|uniref:Universal stress protein n=3 Tax=Haloarcula TaxID=2237 RepID=A0A847UNF7_HALAR|nr:MULTISPECIES: universal stress protein [Haloarcula]EMA20163.1 UspA domain-containing protein [Haloarcula argentinensis DSM 12282]MDS0254554.1 universal stress protein [Haloarcula argentinensis]NLV13421.1 universal stress protein [Haloarcula argentinensis]GGK55545.1 universal stress protein UspA [Haloarcula sebkhae]GGM40864.1 universal stress protein UspA [Haloarcula argentinensis]
MDIDLVLAPVDGSDQSERAAEYAIAVAERYDADLHLLFVIDERLHRDIDSGDVSATAIAEEHQAFTESIRERFRDAHDGVFETSSATAFSETRLMQTPGSVVLDVAEDLDADFIVVPREERSEGEEAVGRAATYVIEYASQPVLTV